MAYLINFLDCPTQKQNKWENSSIIPFIRKNKGLFGCLFVVMQFGCLFRKWNYCAISKANFRCHVTWYSTRIKRNMFQFKIYSTIWYVICWIKSNAIALLHPSALPCIFILSSVPFHSNFIWIEFTLDFRSPTVHHAK